MRQVERGWREKQHQNRKCVSFLNRKILLEKERLKTHGRSSMINKVPKEVR